MDTRGINTAFAKRIIDDEWRKLKTDQDAAIEEKLKRQSGTLHSGGSGRRYSVTGKDLAITATLIHPDYERYQDMKRLKFGRRNSVRHDEPIVKRTGKKIHNKIIWGRMNSIAFRLFNDLRGEVIKTVNETKKGMKDVVIG